MPPTHSLTHSLSLSLSLSLSCNYVTGPDEESIPILAPIYFFCPLVFVEGGRWWVLLFDSMERILPSPILDAVKAPR